MEYNQNILTGSSISKDRHPALFTEQEIVYGLNADIVDYSNSNTTEFISNVASNKICYKPIGKILGVINLTNPDRFVVFEDINALFLFDASTCTKTLIIKDDCLDITQKIKGVSKLTNDRERIYWIEPNSNNPTRYLEISKLPYVKEGDCESCINVCTNELDCDSLKFNPNVCFPCIELKESVGNLPNGNYQIAIAFSNNKVRVSDYYIYSDILKVHSNTGRTFGIELSFLSCFKSFDEYELVLISHRTDRGTLAQRIGYFDTSQKDISLTELDETFYIPIDLQTLLISRPYYESAEHIAVNSEILVLGGLKEKKTFDYRSLANQITSKWVEVRVPAKEAHLHNSFMRDEVYPITITWVYNDGQLSHETHIAPNVTPESEWLLDAPDNLDHPEVLGESCNEVLKKYWEIYNTAQVTETIDNTCNKCEEVVGNSGTFAYWESKDNLYPEDYPDFGCLPVKYHKFPDNCISHIHSKGECSEPCINILTLQLENIQPPVDCDGNLIDIQGYIINIGDRTNHKSILHKGLLFNTANENIDCSNNILYPNYPFNDLQEDVFLGSDLIRDSNIFDSNNSPLNSYNQDKFTYHSPDIHYIKGGNGTELKIYTNEIGKISGEYHYTEDYPKYQILSTFAKTASQAAGLIEANIALNGEKCTTTITESICNKIAERVNKVEGFPTPNITSNTNIAIAPPGTTIIESTTTTVDTTTYTETQAAIGECDENEFSINSGGITIVDCESGDTLNSSNLDTDNCCLKFETDAEQGVILTITIDNNQYQGTIDGSGETIIQIYEDCDDEGVISLIANDANNKHSFTPECPCTGDLSETTRVETQDCEAKIDLIKDRDWFEQIPIFLYYYSQGMQAVHNFLKSIVAPTNYAVQYTAIADYNDFTCEGIVQGNTRRLINNQQYLLPIKQFVLDDRINNWCRESSEFFELSSPLENPNITDNSRKIFSDVFCDNSNFSNGADKDCGGCTREFPYCTLDKDGELIQASSYYVGIKRDKPNQYGNLNNFITKPKTCILTGTNTEPIFGGDIFISKFSVTRKMPLFKNNPLGLPNNTDWNTIDYTNVGIPKYWLNQSGESVVEDLVEILPLLGGFFRDFNLEDICSLCECGESIDLGNLNAEELAILTTVLIPLIQFITNGDDFDLSDALNVVGTANTAGALAEWILNLAKGNVKNIFKQSGIFYTHVTGIANFWVESEFINPYRDIEETLPKHYPVEDAIEVAKSTNYHLPETFLYNLQYHWKGLSKESLKSVDCCPTNDRIIYSVKNDNDSKSDSWLNFPALNFQQFSTKDGKLTGIVEIDDYNLFISFENAVYVTQYEDTLTTDNGSLLYVGSPNAFQRRLKKLATECSGYTGTTSPESIVQSRYGLIWVDDKRKRVFHYNGQLRDITGEMDSWFRRYMGENIISGFDPCSKNIYITDNTTGWTISIKPENNFKFTSFHSFIPESYHCLSTTFLTSNGEGLWKHNDKDSYQTYYDIKYPFILGINLNTKFKNSVSQSIEIFAEFYKDKDYDCKIWNKDLFFSEIALVSNCGAMDWKKTKLKDVNDGFIQDKNIIEISRIKNFNFRFDNLYWTTFNQPYFKNLSNGVDFEISKGNDYEPARYDWAKLYLKYTDTNHKALIQLVLNKTDNVYR